MKGLTTCRSYKYPKHRKKGYCCEFDDSGPCNNRATELVSIWKLCDFHAGFIYSTDYTNSTPKPKSLK